jgi:hypothetical protein
MARTSVSISDDLRRRMDAIASEGVNWSAVAVQAFESKLAEIVTKRGVKNMREVIARLKASKSKASSKLKTAGRDAGNEWAKERAEVEELRKLEDMTDDDWNWGAFLRPPADEAYSPGERLVFALRPGDDGDRQAVDRFFRGYADEPAYHEPDFIEGFAEGAMELWDAVKDQLEGDGQSASTMYLVHFPKRGIFVAFLCDPREDGYTGELIEGVKLDIPPGLHDWPEGADRPNPVMGVSSVDPKHYKGFKSRAEMEAAGFTFVGPPATAVDTWKSYLRTGGKP